jgi:hypothetical protein
LPPMQHSIGYLLTKGLRSNFVNKTVDGILRELDQLQAFVEGPNGNMRASTMIRQCSAQQLTFLLRTCPPSTTLHATRRLDSAIASTVHRIIDSSTKFLPPVESSAMQNILSRLFVSIRFGGDGMINSEETQEAAYVGFLLQYAPAIRLFWVTACILSTDTTIETCIQEFERKHHSLQSEGVTWTSPSQIRMQKKISNQLQLLRRVAALRALPTGSPNTRGAHNPLTHHDIARRRQGINNYTCRLKSNPAIWSNRMNDSCFNISFWICNMFNVMGSRTDYICRYSYGLFMGSNKSLFTGRCQKQS